jgi:hypothetical protein
VPGVSEIPMTQQYIAGEFSALLAELQPAPSASLANAVHDLRREIELGPLPGLPRLAREAMTLTDLTCWVALEQGDVGGFSRCAGAAVALREFAVSANLLR